MKIITIEHADWTEEAKKRYGSFEDIKFRCPICGYSATVKDYQAANSTEGMIGFSCIGRLIGAKRQAFGGNGEGPCDYAGGGFFKMNPIQLTKNGKPLEEIFDFADDPLCKE